jgi:hypothetical protein
MIWKPVLREKDQNLQPLERPVAVVGEYPEHVYLEKVDGGILVRAACGMTAARAGWNTAFLANDSLDKVVVARFSFAGAGRSKTLASVEGEAVVWDFSSRHGGETIAVLRRGATFTVRRGSGLNRRCTVLPDGSVEYTDLAPAGKVPLNVYGSELSGEGLTEVKPSKGKVFWDDPWWPSPDPSWPPLG